jgi:hypothetical protein
MATSNKKNNLIQTSNSHKKMTETEYKNMLNESRKARGYSLEQAKKYLNIS